MNSRGPGRSIVLLILLAIGASSCSTIKSALRLDGSAQAGLVEVDDLLGRVEHLYVECEIAGRDAQDALDRLHVLVDAGFQGDIVLAYADFLEAVEQSEAQAEILRDGIAPMEKAAERVFAHWNDDLGEYSTEAMRARSEERLRATRERYQAITRVAGPTAAAIERLNQGLSDHALYLAHDLNAESVASIEGEVQNLTGLGENISVGVRKCLGACEEYVRATALRGQLDVAPAPQPEPEPEPEAPSPGSGDEG